jgi:hypothetical protein
MNKSLLKIGVFLISSGVAVLLFKFHNEIFDQIRLLSYSAEDKESLQLLIKITVAQKLIKRELDRYERLNAVSNRNATDPILKQEILELDQDIDFIFSRLDTVKGSDSTIKTRRKDLADTLETYVTRVDVLKQKIL